MANRLVKITCGAAAGKEPAAKLLPGERLTGKVIFPGMVTADLWVEVWDNATLYIKSAVVPATQQLYGQNRALLGNMSVSSGLAIESHAAYSLGKPTTRVENDSSLVVWHDALGAPVDAYFEVE